MLDQRKSLVLRAIVEEYVETASPVGSSNVARSSAINVSPATVRNDMAFLEAEGYLQQPHTSAGRIPTDKGYRYFVDNHASSDRLAKADSIQVREFFDRAHQEVGEMLRDTTSLLSGLTDHAAVVVPPSADQGTVRSVQLVSLSDHLALLVLVASTGAVEKHTIELADDVSEADLTAASAHLSAALVGVDRRSIAPVAASGDDTVDSLAAIAIDALDDASSSDLQMLVGGRARMASSFEAVETVRGVLTLLEEQFVVISVIRELLDGGLRVSIGTENGIEPLSECSLVVAPYHVDGEPVGSLGVLGPTRMDYTQTLAAVAVVSQRLGRRLTEG